jgi:hypothetical protein
LPRAHAAHLFDICTNAIVETSLLDIKFSLIEYGKMFFIEIKRYYVKSKKKKKKKKKKFIMNKLQKQIK